MRSLSLALVVIVLLNLNNHSLWGQMVEHGDTLYGNEWIDYDQSYIKLKIGADGIYRVSYDLLASRGLDNVEGDRIELFHLGESQKIYVSNPGIWEPGDYALFVGQKNRSELDKYLFEDPGQMLNPGYSLVSDTSVYFLTISESVSNHRFALVPNDLTGDLPNTRASYMHTEIISLHERAFKPGEGGNRSFSHYVPGEGYGSAPSKELRYSIPVSAVANSGSTPLLSYRIAGNNESATISLNWSNQDLEEVSFDDSELILGELDLTGLNLTDGNFSVTSQGGNIVIGHMQLDYPRSFSWYEKTLWKLYLDNARDGVVFDLIEIPGSNIWVFDLESGQIIEASATADPVQIHLPSGMDQRNLIIIDPQTQIQDLTVATAANFDRLDQSNAQFVMVSHPALRNSASGMDPVREYADYRSSQTGGNYRTQIVNIQQLVDQFAYGVSLHPLSVKNFTNYIYRHWTDPQFLFLVGKGLQYPVVRTRQESYQYLPVYGAPGSDNLLTSRLNIPVPLIPMGRLAARNPADIITYLDKIKVMEDQIANAPRTIEDRLWMKRAMHLSAGNDNSPGEKTAILSALNSMASSLNTGYIGGSTRTITKTSSDLGEGSASEEHLRYLNSGVLIKNYFGHGSSTATQFNGFEDPFFLDNVNRYPIMLSLGCYTGNIFQRLASLGETNILSANKGAIGYIATSGLGGIASLDQMANFWYREIGGESYGRAIGLSVKNTLEAFTGRITAPIRRLSEQLVYHGDPAYIPQSDEFPDYLVNRKSIRIHPDFLHQELDRYQLKLQLVNLGRHTGDTVTISFAHQTPSGKIIPLKEIRKRLNGAVDSIFTELTFPEGEEIIGVNKLLISVDPEDELQEVRDGGESNNQVLGSDGTPGIDMVIYQTGISPMFPTEFSIVTTDPMELIARTANPVGETGSFELEIDTTAHFDSPLLTTSTLEGQSGIIRWKPEITMLPNTVYYWRVRQINSSEEAWMEASFTYIPGDRFGFNHSHYFQLLENRTEGITIDSLSRRMQFTPASSDFTLRIRASRGDLTGLGGFVNGTRWSDFARWDVREGITFVISDPTNPYGFQFNTKPGEYGSITTRTQPIAAFPFSTKTQESRMAIINFLENVVQDSVLVFAYTTQANPNLTLNIPEWEADSITNNGKNIFNVFESLGARRIRQLKTGARPYLFVFEKNKQDITEQIVASPTEEIEFQTAIPKVSNHGSYHSVKIGPANQWTELNSDIAKESGDSATLEIYGIDRQDVPTLIFEAGGNGTKDLSFIDASQYPYLAISARFADSTNYTSPNLEQWRVYYEGKPDLAIGYTGVDRADCDTNQISQESINLSLPILNASAFNWPDSTRVRVSLTDEANVAISDTFTGPPIPAGESIDIPIQLNIHGKSGRLQLVAEINPGGDFEEVYRDNNILSQCYYVPEDLTDPVLNVFFEGRRIMDGELVARNPEITISLKDENKLSLLTDSSLVSIYYIDPEGNRVTPRESGEELEFIAASDSSNEARMLFYPQFEAEGTYVLHVNARDNNDNKAGESDYSVSFRISNEEVVGDVVPYPNPFTTRCRFLYTVHGSIIPENFAIRIYSLSGRVVKTITRNEIGPLRVGTNLTDYEWDGTDSYGDKLANGVYLYKVLTDSEHFEDRALNSAFMEKGYGKLTILR